MVTEPGARAQEKICRAVDLLKEVWTLLQEAMGELPAPENEAMLLGDEEPDVATEVRSIVECSLADQIGPAMRDLAAAAGYRPKVRKK